MKRIIPLCLLSLAWLFGIGSAGAATNAPGGLNYTQPAVITIPGVLPTSTNVSPVIGAGGDTQPLRIPTYDLDPSATHPSVIDYAPNTFGGHRFWMAFTPYTGGVSSRENPSVVCSDDGVNWFVPLGLTNPVFTVSEAESIRTNRTGTATAFWADTEMFTNYGKLVLVAKWGTQSAGDRGFYVKQSTDGIHWLGTNGTMPYLVLNAGGVCPEIVDLGTGALPLRWYFGTNSTLVYQESDRALTHFSAVTNCGLSPVWHFDVKKSGSTYWCLYSQSSTVAMGLGWASSTNGRNWTVRSADSVHKSGYAWDAGCIYKPEFLIKALVPPTVDLYGGAVIPATGQFRIGLYANITLPWTNSMVPILAASQAASFLSNSATVVLPMDQGDFVTCAVTNHASVSFSLDRGASADGQFESKKFRLMPCGSAVSCTFPATWVWLNNTNAVAAAPSTFGPDTDLFLSLIMASTNVIARAEYMADVFYDPDTLAFLTAVPGLSNSVKVALDTFVKGLKAADIWSKETLIYPIVGATAAGQAVNLRSPGTFNLSYPAGAMDHTTNGMAGNGSSTYADTGYSFSGATSNDLRGVVYVDSDGAQGAYYYGTTSTNAVANRFYSRPSAACQQTFLVNGNAAIYKNGARGDNLGLWLFQRAGDTNNVQALQAGQPPETIASPTPDRLPTYSVTLGAYHNNVSPGNFTAARISGFAVGKALSAGQLTIYTNLWQTFQTALNRQK